MFLPTTVGDRPSDHCPAQTHLILIVIGHKILSVSPRGQKENWDFYLQVRLTNCEAHNYLIEETVKYSHPVNELENETVYEGKNTYA